MSLFDKVKASKDILPELGRHWFVHPVVLHNGPSQGTVRPVLRMFKKGKGPEPDYIEFDSQTTLCLKL